MNSIPDQIRATLRESGSPMTMDAIAQANSWTSDVRKQAFKSIGPMKDRHEVRVVMEEGRAAYELVKGFVARAPGVEGKTMPAKPTPPANAVRPTDESQIPLLSSKQAPVPKDSPAPDQSLRSFLAHRLQVLGDSVEQLLGAAIDADADKVALKSILAASRELRNAGSAIA